MEHQALSYESYINLIEQLDELVAIFEDHSDPATQEQATALLSGLDMLHREGLQRLVSMVKQAAGQDVIDQAVEDPVVEILLGLYGLANLDLPEETEQSQETKETSSSQGFVPLEDITVFDESDVSGEE